MFFKKCNIIRYLILVKRQRITCIFNRRGSLLKIRTYTHYNIFSIFIFVILTLSLGSYVASLADDNSPPIFTDGTIAIRSVLENTAAGMNIGSPVSATDADNDTLTYSLNGVDADSFDIDTSTGQLKTKLALDYETKQVYVITITVSDTELTGTITVIINVIDVAETTIVSTVLSVSDRTTAVRDAIVAAAGVSAADDVTDTHLAAITTLNLRNKGISELKTGDFEGLSGLSSLNLYGNSLNSLPAGIFSGLTSLTSLRLGGNLVDPMPLMVSLQQVTGNQYKARISEGAPFDVVLPINNADEISITIGKGSTESATFTGTTSVSIGSLPTLPTNHFGYILTKSTVCNRTAPVTDTITATVPGIEDCRDVTAVHLASITALDLSGQSISSLDSDDLSGLFSLTSLNLSNNQLSSLPDGIFQGLSSITSLNLSGNTVDPFPLTVMLQKVGTNQVKVVTPTAAPFTMVLPLSFTNGIGADNISSATIPIGTSESSQLTVLRQTNTSDAVTVDFGSMPSLPSGHTGYTITKSNLTPLEILSATNVAPEFTEGTTATRTIAENTGSGVDIGDPVTATDADGDTLIYSLSGTDAGSFGIDSSSGQLRTHASLDYETKSSYSVTFSVSDSTLTDTIEVTINITDVDESTTPEETVDTKDDTPPNNAPEFTEGETASRSIAENTGSGVNIGEPVSATDSDKDTLTYTLGGSDAASFSINSTNGQLRTNAALDYETDASYSVTITVSDGNGGSDSIAVTINVTDVDEMPANTAPIFTEGGSATRSIAENTGSGVNIGDPVSATDADGDTLTYSLSGTDAASFSIGSRNGQLRTSATLDYEVKGIYTVIVNVSDNNGGSDSITVMINITDIDERPANTDPIFTEGDSTTRPIAENTGSGANIGDPVSATDADGDTLTYSLSGTDAASFSIGSTNGQLRTSSPLDYETKDTYEVIVNVSDNNGGGDSITVSINVTDVDERPANTDPGFTEGDSTTRSIAENTGTGANIGDPVAATDADNDTLTYSLGGTDAAVFSIGSTNGQLRTSASLDYETKDIYTVIVNVSDNNGGSDSITVTISVTDVDETPVNNSPEFTDDNPTSRSIAENTGSGVDIGSAVSATDADGDTMTYSLGGADASSFNIVSSSGQLRTSTSLDFESDSSYEVTVNVSDNNGGSDSIAVTITVTDVNEAPTFPSVSTTRTIAENVPAGINIGNAVSAVDPDSDDLTYTLSGTDAVSFDIESSTGQLKTKVPLDFETKSTFSVTVAASDGNLADTISVTIRVRDLEEAPSNVAPVFAQDETTRSVAENTDTGQNIGAPITATDEDSTTLVYLLSGTDASSFSIDENTGQLKTSTALNFEKKTAYTITVTVSDGSLTDTITVTINITNVNEAPVYERETARRGVDENTAAGQNIGRPLSATDPDAGDTLTYTLEGTDAAKFDIVSTSGQLQTKAALDFEEKNTYSVIVKASDTGGMSDSIAVTVNVRDVDENRAPVFTDGTNTERAVDENMGSGVDIGTPVTATDADDDTLTYSLGGTDAASFEIDSTTGQLRTKAALDYEDKDTYSVLVSVSDNNGGNASINVTIEVNDVQENRAPVFTDGTDTERSVDENTGSGVDIGTPVAATDADDDTLTYSLGGTDASSFEIDSTTGQLRTKVALDYETKDTYSVIVSVSDNEGGNASINVTIEVNDIQENRAPVFTDGTSTSRSVDENTSSGVDIGGPVAATDADNDTLAYDVGGTDGTSFDIDSTSGQLRTKDALDFEDKNTYSVIVSVSDNNGGNASIDVTIEVNDVQENRDPVFTEGTSTTRSVDENTGAGEDIGDPVEATDADNDTLSYEIGGTDGPSFDIDSTSGQLRTKDVLDFETKDTYSVIVSVSDNNGGNASITVTIKVNDVDENRAPEFASATTTRSVDENSAAGVNIGTPVTATDADDDTLEYTLEGSDAASFDIDSSTGQLMTKSALNYESDDEYSVVVKASDDSLSGTITVTIEITNVNEAPVFASSTATRSVAENTDAGVNIGTPVSATDEDGDTLEYTLEGADAASFDIESSTGQLMTKAALDYETDDEYAVTVKASDDSLSDTIAVTIEITDVQENRAPKFATADFSRSISNVGNASVGDNIGDPVTATDTDNDTLEYSVGGTDAAFFNIVSSTGQLQVTQALIDDTSSSYSITVVADDSNGGTDEISGTISVTRLTRADLNTAPVFTDGTSATREVAENTASGENIGDPVSATDADTGDTLTYTLEGTDAASFSIVSTSGQLQTSAALDYETKNSYSVTVKVTDDSGGTNATVTIPVTINVTDVDEGGTITPVNTRTAQVRNAILRAIPGVNSAGDVTAAHLAEITSLTITRTGLASLQSGDLDGLTGLTNLSLFNNDFNSLPADIFDELVALTDLDLSFNEFTTLSDGIFDELTSLKTLDLSFNGITSLPDGIFDELTALEELDLGVNEFTTLPADIFDDLSSLKILAIVGSRHFSDNQLTSLPEGIFDGLTSLEEIDLEGNLLTSLPDDVFDENTSLIYIRLTNNKIASLSSGVFDELTELTTLYLEINKLTSIPDDVFDKNTKLTDVNLTWNELTSLPDGIFDELTELLGIRVSSNELTSVPDGIFDNNTNLTVIDLSYNEFTSLPSDLISSLTNLTHVNISHNNLTALPDGFLVGLTQLENFRCGDQGEDDNDILIEVTLQKVADGQFKAVCPVGVPFKTIPELLITNGAVDPDEITMFEVNGVQDTIIDDLQIPVGHSESGIVDVLRTSGTTGSVTVDIKYVVYHRIAYSFGEKLFINPNDGYELVRDPDTLPIEVIPEVDNMAPRNNPSTPENTTLLTNYPNPFNPETWIPYQLSESADVTLTIYNMRGVVVRKLALGHKKAGYYTNKSRAAYWDGKNSIGESVAAGVYFTTFKAGDYTATRKMLIRK